MKKIPIIPGRGLVTAFSTKLRHKYLDSLNIKTLNIANTIVELDNFNNNIESFIGTTEIPLGIVGPLLYNTKNESEFTYCSIGTLEGALVASMNRGAKAISKSGGFFAKIKHKVMSRVPMFIFHSEDNATIFNKYVNLNFIKIKEIAESYSNHAILNAIIINQDKNVINLRFNYFTGDASGQNMTTICTWHAILFLIDKFKEDENIVPLDFIIEGNLSADKKISNYNIKNGRGINVTAQCVITEEVITKVLRTSSKKILQTYYPSKKLAKKDNMIGYNVNVANAIAGIFVATGQDLACIHESSVGFLKLKPHKNGLYLELNLTNLVVGTVGGGTFLPKQSEALAIMDCLGSNKVERFAKLIAGFALGLEISTYAAIVSGEFAKAHEKLGRNKPVNWLLKSEINSEFIKNILKSKIDVDLIKKLEIKKEDFIENGILTEIAAKTTKKIIGFIPFVITYKDKIKPQKLLIKSKPLANEVIKGLHIIAASIAIDLADLINKNQQNLEYYNSHIKEIHLYEYLSNANKNYMPTYFGSYINNKREIYILVQELVNYADLRIVNSENNPNLWSKTNILKLIDAITDFHQIEKSDTIKDIEEFLPYKSTDLYQKLMTIIIDECVDKKDVPLLNSIYNDIVNLEQEMNDIKVQKTVIHNDFNPRNIMVCKNGKPIIYDWELAVVDFPHRDIIEFLSFVLTDNFKEEELIFYLKYHFKLYKNQQWVEWKKAYQYCLKVYIISRVSFYEVSSILVNYKFSKRILKNSLRMLTYLNNEN